MISLGVPWFISAWLLGAFPKGAVTLPRLLGLLASPSLGDRRAHRAGDPHVLVGRGGIPIPFLIVTLAAGGLFLLGWRLIFWLIFLRPGER